MGHGTCLEVRGQFCGADSLLPPLYGLQGFDSGGQTNKTRSLPSEPSHPPKSLSFQLMLPIQRKDNYLSSAFGRLGDIFDTVIWTVWSVIHLFIERIALRRNVTDQRMPHCLGPRLSHMDKITSNCQFPESCGNSQHRHQDLGKQNPTVVQGWTQQHLPNVLVLLYLNF